MIAKVQESIIERVADLGDITCRRYYGELSSPKEPKLTEGELPLVLVDFVGDKPQDATRVILQFNIYIVHVSYSANIHTRAKKHQEVLSLMESVDRVISLPFGSSIVTLKTLKKIYDGISSKGYLTVFMRQVELAHNRDYTTTNPNL